MNFREELAKELGLGAIAEETMLNDYIKACEAIAIRYHNSEVEKLNKPAVSVNEVAVCDACGSDITIIIKKCGKCGNTIDIIEAN